VEGRDPKVVKLVDDKEKNPVGRRDRNSSHAEHVCLVNREIRTKGEVYYWCANIKSSATCRRIPAIARVSDEH